MCGRICAACSTGGPLGPLLGAIHEVRGPFAVCLALVLLAIVPALTLRLLWRPCRFDECLC